MAKEVEELLTEYAQLFNLPKTLLGGRLPSRPSTLRRKYLGSGEEKFSEERDFSDVKVVAGMATMQGRDSIRTEAIESIASQVDELHIYHNYGELKNIEEKSSTHNVFHHRMPMGDIGDIGKYYFLLNGGVCDYFFSVDDDIRYPSDYVRKTLGLLRKYGKRAVMSWHGSIIKPGFEDYYSPSSRRVFTFGSRQSYPARLDIVGTGASAWCPSFVPLTWKDFESPNMADIFFSRRLVQLGVPAFLVPHSQGEAVDLSHLGNSTSIYHNAIKGAKSRPSDYRKKINAIVSSTEWPSGKFARKVLLVARTPEFSRKGGVLASGVQVEKTLQQMGCKVDTIDPQIVRQKAAKVGKNIYDIGLVYTGDRNSRDRVAYDFVVRQNYDFPMFVNPSFDGSEQRTEEIVENNLDCKGDLTYFVFSEQAKKEMERVGLKARMLLKPGLGYSSISVGRGRPHPMTRPMLLGDLGKFLNKRITPRNKEIFELLSSRFGDRRLAFLNQYEPDEIPDWFNLDAVTVYSFQKNFSKLRREVLMYVHLNSHATFEMLPYELANLGLPIAGRGMDQSLNYYLGPRYLQANTDHELVSKLQLLESLCQRAHDYSISQNSADNIDPIFAQSLFSLTQG